MAHTVNPYLHSYTKRTLDIAVATAALPVYVSGIGLSSIAHGTQPTTSHERQTADGTELIIKKFNLSRYKRLGKKLIGLGFDEVPQVTSIIRGSMSLVGPRALRESDMDTFLRGLNPTLRQGWLEALAGVKPGVISTYALAEHGHMTDKDRAVMDIYDAQNASLRHDLYLLRHLGRTPTKSVVIALEEYPDETEEIKLYPSFIDAADCSLGLMDENGETGIVA